MQPTIRAVNVGSGGIGSNSHDLVEHVVSEVQALLSSALREKIGDVFREYAQYKETHDAVMRIPAVVKNAGMKQERAGKGVNAAQAPASNLEAIIRRLTAENECLKSQLAHASGANIRLIVEEVDVNIISLSPQQVSAAAFETDGLNSVVVSKNVSIIKTEDSDENDEGEEVKVAAAKAEDDDDDDDDEEEEEEEEDEDEEEEEEEEEGGDELVDVKAVDAVEEESVEKEEEEEDDEEEEDEGGDELVDVKSVKDVEAVEDDDEDEEAVEDDDEEEEAVEEEAVEEEAVEEEAVEEEAVEEDDEEEEEEEVVEVIEITINNKSYFTTNETDGIIYECTRSGDIGNEVGKFNGGRPKFNKSR